MSASEKIIEKSLKSVEVTDSLGRKIVLRKPSRWEFMEFLGLIGAKAGNSVYLGWALPVLFARQIDQDLLAPLDDLKNFRSNVEELGDEGHDAAMEAVSEHFPDYLAPKEMKPEEAKKKSEK